MARNIVLLSDGTGNSAAKLFRTNVWRLYEALDLGAGDQIAFYDDGVGTSTVRPLALAGGAFGLGLRRNVRQLYAYLCRNHEPDDRIYAFGFSRGAFTIRVLVGLLTTQGVIPGRTLASDDLEREVRAAHASYREGYQTHWSRWRKGEASNEAVVPPLPPGRRPAPITFLGLWDTVDAYGLPNDELKRGLDYWWLGLSFPDQNLSPIVQRACHALALDDERNTFHPVLWNEKAEKDLVAKGIVEPDRLKQVWFAGMHSNVGGGYAKDALAHVSLVWMLREAAKAGLRFHEQAVTRFENLANPHAEIGDSRSGLAAYYRYNPRRLDALLDDDYKRVWIDRPKIHRSVFDRIAARHVDYNPHVVPSAYEVVGDSGGDPVPGYETADEAARRTEGLERARDLVWWRRVAYFASIVFTVCLIGLPWLFGGADETKSVVFRPVELLLVAAGNTLPGWLGFWIDAFRQKIDLFLALLAGLGLAVWFGSYLYRRIATASAEAWKHVNGTRPPTKRGPAGWPKIARPLRQSRPLLRVYRATSRQVVPFVFFLLTVAASVGVSAFALNRMLFDLGEAAGKICTPTADRELRQITRGDVAARETFGTSDPCFATGIHLEEGETYTIAVRVLSPWSDGGKLTSPRGFRSRDPGVTWRWRLFWPARRIWTAKWFEPIARIGHTGFDRYRLRWRKSADGEFVASFTPSDEGELFLFVNDAVVGAPKVWSRFYTLNNDGTAAVSVRLGAVEGRGAGARGRRPR